MKIISLLLLFISLSGYAQFQTNAPWNHSNHLKKTLIFNNTVDEANTYFNNKDINKKGSGYKPFKRWEYFRSFYKNKEGSLISADELWHLWEQKMQLGQKSNKNANEIVSNWSSLGPYSFSDTGSWSSGQGRVNFLIVDPNNENIYYTGTPSGGMWKSTNAGLSWTPLTDFLPQIGISGIAIDPSNSDTIYATTGDDDAGDSYFFGVIKSTDGGATWNVTGEINGVATNEIYIDPSNPQIVWVANDSGLYKSMNGGDSWNLKQSGNIKDFKLKPGNPNVVYAVTESIFYKSLNGGDTFKQISSGLPTSSGRFTIDVSPANPEYIYLLSAKDDMKFQGVYKSTDSGNTFTKTLESDDIFDLSQQAWYDMALCASDINAETIFTGVLNIWKSTNAGNNFIKINDWNNDTAPAYTHADIHFLRYYNGVLFAGTDGGLYKSTDNGTTFTNLTTGMAIGQFYKISVAKQSAQNVVGGLQDNGGFAYSEGNWNNYYGADGMDVAVNPNNKNEYYGFIQSGSGLYKTKDGGLSSSFVASSTVAGNWITPLVSDNEGNLYAGFDQLYKLVGSTWTQVSNHPFLENLTNIEINPTNNQIIYVSRGLKLYKSTNSGVDFTTLSTSFSGDFITSVEVNSHNSEIVYLTTSGSSGKVYKSMDGGASWNDITYNLPNESKNVIRHQKYNVNNPIYVGTYLGVYYLDDTSNTWQPFFTNLPNSNVTDLEINENDNLIIASTYGRGIWKSAVPLAQAANDASFVEPLYPLPSVNCGSVTPSIRVKNNGTNPINQINVSYVVAGQNYNYTWNGTLLSTNTTDIVLNELNLEKGLYKINFNISIDNDTYSDNNTGEVSFYIDDLDSNPNAVNPFENSSNQWLVITDRVEVSDLWEIAYPGNGTTLSSGSNAYITNPNGNYTNNTVSDLYTPCYNLTTLTHPVMKFKMAFDIELDWDVMYVQFSVDNGKTWQVLGTANDLNWYNNSSNTNALTIGGQWSGKDTTLKEYSYDLSAFTGESQIIFRFHFASDEAVNGEGVLIDDFVIDGTLANEDLQYVNRIKLYPNPTHSMISIEWPHAHNTNFNLYDITGKLIKSGSIQAYQTYNLDLENISNGVYFLNFISNTNHFSKKIIKE